MKNDQESILLSREKHLDHMVRVVPFIFFCYLLQCFVVFKISPTQFSATGLSILGGFLAMMVGAFITYDLKHRVLLTHQDIQINFGPWTKSIKYHDILEIKVPDPTENFSTIIFHTVQGKFTIYFIDDAQKIKSWIEEKRLPVLKAA